MTAEQVASSLAEKIKAHVTPDIFAQFRQVLLAGIGKNGIKTGETITFFWAAPELFRIFVRGSVCGSINSQTLPLILHKGFLGDDPAVPEVKQSIVAGLHRLLVKRVSDNGGVNGGRVGELVAPRTVVEPITKLSLPGTLQLEGKNRKNISLSLLSKGPSLKRVPVIGNVQVYAVGIYVDPIGAKRVLHANGWCKEVQDGQSNSTNDAKLFETLAGNIESADDTFFARCLHLVFARNVSYAQFSGALAERLKLVAEPDAFEALSRALETGIASGLKKGETVTYLWHSPGHLRVFVRGKSYGNIENASLPRFIHLGFLGADPKSPEAKEEIPAAARKLFGGA